MIIKYRKIVYKNVKKIYENTFLFLEWIYCRRKNEKKDDIAFKCKDSSLALLLFPTDVAMTFRFPKDFFFTVAISSVRIRGPAEPRQKKGRMSATSTHLAHCTAIDSIA